MFAVPGFEWTNDAAEHLSPEIMKMTEEVFNREFIPALDFEVARERIRPLLQARDGEHFDPKLVPHRNLNDDLAVVYLYQPKDEKIPMVKLNNGWLEDIWHVDEPALFAAALENNRRIGYHFGHILDAMREIGGLDQELSHAEKSAVPLYVLSTQDVRFGASVMLDPQVMDDVMGKQDCYILPSSVHELILIPKNAEELDYLRETVRAVNLIIEPEVYLSDEVFEYDRRTKSIRRAATVPEKQKERFEREER